MKLNNTSACFLSILPVRVTGIILSQATIDEIIAIIENLKIVHPNSIVKALEYPDSEGAIETFIVVDHRENPPQKGSLTLDAITNAHVARRKKLIHFCLFLVPSACS
jgi:hypothetical protein